MNDRVQQIRARLQAGLDTIECVVEDESALHAGHAGAASGGGHYRVRLVSSRFEAQNRVMRHRLVYDCLRDMMQQDIHALAIVALTPAEADAGTDQ
ncbi:BolA family protein [Noviherbaspirillum pedocola]|uniref:BolA family transcriptional regulator n=1 Tax=Noviherbaspirillum pedocola TaxID=2801341 RepID=A0A934SSV7_9BURK|nr:BolA family protein [Noviherbaspirillum pedocola]MBK4734571.1 BolA family transcriptional regulator [Noviherbaspirillum pedocola]